MRFVLPFTEQDVRRGDQVPLTPNLVAKATFEGVRAAFNYWVFCLVTSNHIVANGGNMITAE